MAGVTDGIPAGVTVGILAGRAGGALADITDCKLGGVLGLVMY